MLLTAVDVIDVGRHFDGKMDEINVIVGSKILVVVIKDVNEDVTKLGVTKVEVMVDAGKVIVDAG